MSPLRAIFFDAGNTLLRMDYAAIAQRLAELGVGATAPALQEAEWRARVRLDGEVLSRVDATVSTEVHATHERYLAYLLEGVGVTDASQVAAMAEWRRSYNLPVGLWGVADPEAEAALALARGAGIGAAVISNSNGSIRGILDALNLSRHLDFVIDSSEVGVEKPDPRIFKIALERAGLAPGEVAYVGDLYSVDVLGARRAGITPVLLDPGACWGERDCDTAPGVLAAVRLVMVGSLEGPAGGSTPSIGG